MKRAIAVLLLMFFIFGFTGCGSAASSSNSTSSEGSSEVSKPFDPAEKTIAICMSGIDHPMCKIVQLGFIEGARELGYEHVIVSGLATEDIKSYDDLQKKWETDITENGVDGIIFWASDSSGYELMKKWHDQGIKIVVPYREHDYEDTHEFIDANLPEDVYAVGYAAAEYIDRTLTDSGQTDAKIGLADLGLSMGNLPYIEGFRNWFQNHETNFTLLDTIFLPVVDNELTTAKAKEYLAKYPEMAAVFCAKGDGASSWSEAKEALGHRNVCVVVKDYTATNLDALKDGGIDALVATPIYKSGYESAIVLDRLLRGAEFSESEWQQPLGCEIITANGEGENGLDYYYDLYARCEALDWDNYLS